MSRGRHDSHRGEVLAAPLRTSRWLQLGVALCCAVLVVVSVIRIESYGHLIDAVGVGGLGALFGGVFAMNDARLIDRGAALEIRNPLLIHRVPWAAITDIDSVNGLTVTAQQRRITVSAVPTGNYAAFSQRLTARRATFADALLQRQDANQPGRLGTDRSTRPNLGSLLPVFFFAGAFELFGLAYWLVAVR